jgi:hypothetical protein
VDILEHILSIYGNPRTYSLYILNRIDLQADAARQKIKNRQDNPASDLEILEDTLYILYTIDLQAGATHQRRQGTPGSGQKSCRRC